MQIMSYNQNRERLANRSLKGTRHRIDTVFITNNIAEVLTAAWLPQVQPLCRVFQKKG